jgi:transaldolase
MPEATLKAVTEHEEFVEALPLEASAALAEFGKPGLNTDSLAARLLEERIASFDKSWSDLLACIGSKSHTVT